MAKVWNEKIFKDVRKGADAASVKLAKERGPCEDARDAGMMARFSHKLAVAPTASISIICGGTSAGIEPIPANVYTHKTLSGRITSYNVCYTKLLRGLCLPSGSNLTHHDLNRVLQILSKTLSS